MPISVSSLLQSPRVSGLFWCNIRRKMPGGWKESDPEVNHAYEKYLDKNGVS